TGSYNFTNLPPGTYNVTETTIPAPDYAVSSNPGMGSHGTVVSKTQIKVAATTPGSSSPLNDFVVNQPVSIAGTVYLDHVGGAPVSTVTITLTDAGGNPAKDINGNTVAAFT